MYVLSVMFGCFEFKLSVEFEDMLCNFIDYVDAFFGYYLGLVGMSSLMVVIVGSVASLDVRLGVCFWALVGFCFSGTVILILLHFGFHFLAPTVYDGDLCSLILICMSAVDDGDYIWFFDATLSKLLLLSGGVEDRDLFFDTFLSLFFQVGHSKDHAMGWSIECSSRRLGILFFDTISSLFFQVSHLKIIIWVLFKKAHFQFCCQCFFHDSYTFQKMSSWCVI